MKTRGVERKRCTMCLEGNNDFCGVVFIMNINTILLLLVILNKFNLLIVLVKEKYFRFKVKIWVKSSILCLLCYLFEIMNKPIIELRFVIMTISLNNFL